MTSLSASGCTSTMCKQDEQTCSPSHKSPQSDASQETGRKKRTFDIAFLTGQSESNNNGESDKESNNNKHHYGSHVLKGGLGSSLSGQTIRSTSSPEPDYKRESPYNLSRNHANNHHDYSSDTSVEMDVDVMTNGSLSDADVEDVTPIIPTSSITNHHSNKRHHHHQSNSSTQYHRSRVLLSLSQSHYNNHQNHVGKMHHRPQQGIATSSNTTTTSTTTPSRNAARSTNNNGKVKGKSAKNAYQKNTPVKEEIRFESISKRTIDINHTQDSLKIKENLQFSTLIPTNSLQGGQGQLAHPHAQHPHHHMPPHPHHHQHPHPGDFNEFILPPHLVSTFALFPHIGNMSMSKFPGLLPVHVPMGGGQSSQPSSLSPNSNHHNNANGQQNQLQQQHGSHSGIHFSSKVDKSEGSFHHHNNQHNNHNLSSSSSSPTNQSLVNQQKIRHHHFSDIYPGYPYPNLIIPPQFSPTGNMPSNQHSPNNVTTLLPPSLTALTLPAQNVCAKCNIGFRMTSDLVYHMRSHHKRDTFDPLKKQREEKLKCPVCHESFRERHHLTRHMTAHQDRVDEAAAAAAALLSTTANAANQGTGESSFGSKSSNSGAGCSSKLVA
ncbi:PR domain zinc finger protein 8 [Folsomia candida]|uniref:PR domain zinc finger protein 8 n=1 Tax=Folsomia candida TaxID=158441 RepID=A0A226DFE5_FOLCA|nr:PR domain zinc finger protein 8 [Folsomia candida]